MRLIALLAACAAVSACSTIGGGNDDIARQVLQNLEHCDRTYTAAIGMGGGGSLNISCKARPWSVADPVADPIADVLAQ